MKTIKLVSLLVALLGLGILTISGVMYVFKGLFTDELNPAAYTVFCVGSLVLILGLFIYLIIGLIELERMCNEK